MDWGYLAPPNKQPRHQTRQEKEHGVLEERADTDSGGEEQEPPHIRACAFVVSPVMAPAAPTRPGGQRPAGDQRPIDSHEQTQGKKRGHAVESDGREKCGALASCDVPRKGRERACADRAGDNAWQAHSPLAIAKETCASKDRPGHARPLGVITPIQHLGPDPVLGLVLDQRVGTKEGKVQNAEDRNDSNEHERGTQRVEQRWLITDGLVRLGWHR